MVAMAKFLESIAFSGLIALRIAVFRPEADFRHGTRIEQGV
jgi:hypothetical protein